MKLLRSTVLGLACVWPALCLAQWQWIDKDGRSVFSDRAPPMDIPARSILRQPGLKPAPAGEASEAPGATPAQATRPSTPVPRLSGKDKDLEAKKQQLAGAEADKKKAQDEENERRRADRCDRAKLSKVTLDSGVRISRTNAQGEREVLDDAARDAEARRVDAIIASECTAAGG